MIDQISSLVSVWMNDYRAFIEQSPVAGGLLSVWLLASASFLLVKTPKAVGSFLLRHFTVTLTATDDNEASDVELYANTLMWLTRNPLYRFSRNITLSARGKYNPNAVDELLEDTADGKYHRAWKTTPDNGTHLCLVGGRLGVAKIFDLDSDGSEKQKKRVTITAIGRDRTIFKEFANAVVQRTVKQDVVEFSKTNRSGGMREYTVFLRERLLAVPPPAVDKAVMSQLHEAFRQLREDGGRRNALGQPNRLSIILHGPPGTGKTRLIAYLAALYAKDVVQVDLSAMDNESLSSIYASRRHYEETNYFPFYVYEDVDDSPVVQKRGEQAKQGAATLSDDLKLLTTAGVLNAMDGLLKPTNVVNIFTTNHLDKLDPAFTRKGRAGDLILEIGALKDETIREYIEARFPDYTVPKGIVFEDILGCDLEFHLNANINDPDKLVASLPKKPYCPRVGAGIGVVINQYG